MSSTPGFPITKPVSVWNKPIKADFKDLFKALGKAAIDGAFIKWDSLAGDAVEAVAALGLATEPGEIAWLLIYRSLTQAMFGLVEGNKDLLIKKPNGHDLEELCDRLDLSLESMELRIDQDFFKRPKKLPIVEAIKTPFAQCLAGFGLTSALAETISHRLPTYFVFALHQEWAKHPEKYACLKEELDTPFTQASEREQAWLRYSAWLQKQVEEPMFLEAFGLKQVYVSPRAYYKRKVEGQKDQDFERRVAEDKQYERVVVDLESELKAWLDKAERNDAIRVISGGPGSGKSSFAKIFAAIQAEREKIPVLFIPLHYFDPSDDLIDAVGKFVSSDPDRILPPNPLAQDRAESRLLIIFDGLDELAMQDKIAAEVAQQFVREVQKKVDRFNQRETRLQVLISGRELVVQANSSEFRQAQQILHILPYFVVEDERERENYINDQNLLQRDQRQLWWQKYGEASGHRYTGLPQELDEGNLTEITSQPLLNYLVALSFVRGKVKFSKDSNLNAVYEDLLKAVYERVWENYPHPALDGIEYEGFVRILEEIALASWHGDGRTTTVKEIETHCDSSGLKRLLDIFQEGAKAGVTRLLTAFYFRQSGYRDKDAEKTFEFTHKSFGEYLTARRIVREVRLIPENLEDRRKNPYTYKGWDERDALKHWAVLCGSSAMDEYIFKFVVDEMRLQNSLDVGNWQQTLCHLIDFMLRHGMPMERLDPRPNFQEENRQARNAEEALLAVLNACARFTQTRSNIEWHSPEAFGAWISRLQGQRVDLNNVLSLNCLSFLNLQGCILYLKDFYRANLQGANLQRAYLERAYLYRANLQGANLQEAYLYRANLQGAYLQGANLQGVNLQGPNLQDANLQGAYLYRANLQGAYLYRANLQLANMQGADLQGADLQKANLERADLQEANLQEANLQETILRGVDLRGADLRGANLQETILRGADLQEADLRGTILEGKDLTELTEDSGSHLSE